MHRNRGIGYWMEPKRGNPATLVTKSSIDLRAHCPQLTKTSIDAI
jgi:hypothetical protein